MSEHDEDEINEHDAFWGPLLAFDRKGPDFVMGVEVGRLWEQIKNPEGFDQSIHACNVEMVMRMQEATGRGMRVEDVGDTESEWVLLVVEPGEPDA